MLVEVQIVETKNPRKTFVAFNNSIRPNKGDTTIGLKSVCEVKEILKGVETDSYILTDGSTIFNPIKIIGEVKEFDFDEHEFDEGPFYVSCMGTQKNPILVRDGSPICLINFY
jgi:hypothetical protein